MHDAEKILRSIIETTDDIEHRKILIRMHLGAFASDEAVNIVLAAMRNIEKGLV